MYNLRICIIILLTTSVFSISVGLKAINLVSLESITYQRIKKIYMELVVPIINNIYFL
jgi:hypothetical protein